MTLFFPQMFGSSAAFEAGARHAAEAVLSGAWQGVLLAGATALLLRVVPGTTARLRFAIWTMVFLVLAILPAVSAFHGASAKSGATAGAPLRVDPQWSYLLAGLWAVAVAGRLGHLALQAVRLRRLWRSAMAVTGEAMMCLDLLLGKVRVCTSVELDRPSVIGFFAPRILIPDWLFEQLTPGELHQIVLHEMEHLRRRDDWMNLLQKIGLVLFPLNPALLWIDRRLATERELACDDGVLSRTHAPRAYATCLTSLAERRLAHRMAERGHGRLTAFALGVLGTIRRSDFSRRVESILDRRPGLSPAMVRVFAALFAAATLGAGGALTHMPELVAFGPDAQPQTQSAAVAPVDRVVPDRSVGSAHFENVVFHPSVEGAGSSAVRMRRSIPTGDKGKPRKTSPVPLHPAEPAIVAKIQQAMQVQEVAERQINEQQRRLMLLTDWQETAPVPVLITLPDGRIFFMTCTPMPTQAGWIVFQL